MGGGQNTSALVNVDIQQELKDLWGKELFSEATRLHGPMEELRRDDMVDELLSGDLKVPLYHFVHGCTTAELAHLFVLFEYALQAVPLGGGQTLPDLDHLKPQGKIRIPHFFRVLLIR